MALILTAYLLVMPQFVAELSVLYLLPNRRAQGTRHGKDSSQARKNLRTLRLIGARALISGLERDVWLRTRHHWRDRRNRGCAAGAQQLLRMSQWNKRARPARPDRRIPLPKADQKRVVSLAVRYLGRSDSWGVAAGLELARRYDQKKCPKLIRALDKAIKRKLTGESVHHIKKNLKHELRKYQGWNTIEPLKKQ